jgi:uncharacterized protein (DUF58 family)
MPAQAVGAGVEAVPVPLLDREDIRALENLSIESVDGIVAGLVGLREGQGSSQGFEFADYRRYAPGDNASRIDWTIYARLRELYVRTAPLETGLWLSVLLDASRSMDTGTPSKLRYGRRLAALLGALALLRSDAVEVHLLSDGDSFSTGSFDSGAGALGTMLTELQRLAPGRGTELARSIRHSGRSGLQPQMAVLISDGLMAEDDLAAALVELARSARSAALVHVCEPAEDLDAWEGSTLLLDSETGRRIDATITPDARAGYLARHERWCADVERRCRAGGLNYVRADARIDPLELLFGAARRQGLVRAGSAG